MPLQRTLSPLETWGFGLTALINWITIAPALHAAIGSSAIFVWLPGIAIGMMLNLQVKQLGEHYPDMAGGTPNYTTRLLNAYPSLGLYAASGYFLSWVATLPISAIVLAQLIQHNLLPLGFHSTETFLSIGFTILPLILTFSGTRALSILHVFFVLPTLGLLLVFSIQGLIWLANSPTSPGLFPRSWSNLTGIDWAKWFYFATYTFYGCDSAASFVADSRNPTKTLHFLKIAAGLMPLVIFGGIWVLMRLATGAELRDDIFLNLLAASEPFWGKAAPLLVTFLLTASCLLSCATVVSNCPRMLYQLALDGYISPVFGVVSRRGAFGPGLILILILSLICLLWGNVPRIVAITNVGWVASLTIFHLGLWLQRGRSEVRWSCWSLGFFAIDAVVLVVGGLAWGWQDFLVGLLFPVALLVGDRGIRQISFAPLHPAWWIRHYRRRSQSRILDVVAFQVVVSIVLIVSATTIGWYFCSLFNPQHSASSNLLAVILLCASFIGVAIACWTSLPEVMALDEARAASSQLYTIAPDAILVLDENGAILQANPAAEHLFRLDCVELTRYYLNQLLPELGDEPEQWLRRSEQTFILPQLIPHTLEVTISDRLTYDSARSDGTPQEYLAILRDITERKQAEEKVKASLHEKEVLLKEVHHRVKNNLQIVSSLFYLQSRYTQDEQVLQLLRDNQDRIHSMALIHEKLYGSEDLGKIDFQDYIYSLVRTLFVSYNVNPKAIALKIDCDRVYLDIDIAIPCGLIVNELISNALKHAFPYGRSGEIEVEFHADIANKFKLVVRDDGIGLPVGFDLKKSKSLGLRLINSLVNKQLEGTIDIHGERGTQFTICLP